MFKESQRCMMMHALGFQGNGKGKFYRNFYCTGGPPSDEYHLFKELEEYGFAVEKNMQHLGIKGMFNLTENGIQYVLKIVSEIRNFKNCMNCKHLEYVAGEVTDPSGNCCNKKDYKNSWEESKHLKNLQSMEYLFKSKRCYEKSMTIEEYKRLMYPNFEVISDAKHVPK